MARNRWISCCIATGLMTSAVWHGAAAQSTAGQLDPSFGSGGTVVAVPRVNSVGSARLQSDGKIVVAAPIQNLNLATLACGLVRFRANGTLDRTFGTGGVVMTAPFSNFINTPSDLAIQPDGKIVVVGGGQSADGSFNPAFVTRFNAGGSVDTGFGTGGVVITSFAKFDLPQVVLLQPDGKILVGGHALPANDEQPQQAILARYTANGSLDATFGQGGQVTGLIGTITALALQQDGKILTNNGSPFLRVLANGTLDSTNTGGTITATARVGTGTFLPSGQFAIAGTTTEFSDRHDIDVQMTRSQQDGTPDPSFASPEIDLGAEGPHAVVYAPDSIAVQADGRLLAAVPVTSASFKQEFGLARFNADGSVDPSFGTGGQVVTPFNSGNGSILYTLVVQPDGKIVAVGLTLPTDTLIPNRLQLARYLGQ